MADIQRLVQSQEWAAMQTDAEREQVLTLFRDSTPEGQEQILSQLTPLPPPVPSAISPETPSPWQALKGAFTGTQRLPGHAGAPEEGTAPETLGDIAGKESTAGKVIAGVTGAVTSPSSIGELVGTTLVPGPLKPVAGAVGAMVGEGYRQWQAGEPLDVRKIGNEGLWSGAFEGAESAGRAILRTASRGTTTGKALMREEAARKGREVAETVFEPKPAAAISQAFDSVRATGMKLDTADLVQHISTLSPGKQADILHTLSTIDSQNKTGGRFVQLYKDLRAGTAGAADIGTLQDLRSQLRQEAERARRLGHGEASYLLHNLQQAVDTTIDTGFAAGTSAATSQATRDLLHTARQEWARRAAADDMSQMIENKIRSSEDLSTVSFQLAGFYDELRKGRSELSRSVDRALDLTPGARDRFNTAMADVAENFQVVTLPKVQGLEQVLSYMMLSPTLREALRGAIVQGRGTVSPNTMALLVNAARREMAPAMTRGTSARNDEESRRVPGGPARQTD